MHRPANSGLPWNVKNAAGSDLSLVLRHEAPLFWPRLGPTASAKSRRRGKLQGGKQRELWRFAFFEHFMEERLETA